MRESPLAGITAPDAKERSLNPGMNKTSVSLEELDSFFEKAISLHNLGLHLLICAECLGIPQVIVCEFPFRDA